MNQLEIDFETRSDVDLLKRGSYVYFESPHTKPLMASYIVDGGPVRRWLPHEPCPTGIRLHVEAGGLVAAHNCGSFERLLWQKILTPRYGWPELRLKQCRCTLATASALGLPRSLEKLGDALNLIVKKDKAGKDLIRFFCLPRKPLAGEDPNGVYFNEPADHAEKFEQFRSYCDFDILTEAEADSRMIPLSDDEQAVWVLDQLVNDRGIRIDRRSAIAAINLVEKAKTALDWEMRGATGNQVKKCSQVAQLKAWAESQGVTLDGVAKDDILAALQLVDLPANVKRALLLRQEAGKSSTSKLKAFLARAGADGRARGAFVYHGAAPGRWSSTGVNFGNMPRPRALFNDAHLDQAALFEAFRSEEPDLLRLLYGAELGRPLHLVSDAIRGFIMAAPGYDFITADYSNIQGAICAWLSNEEWRLTAMREIFADPKNNPDLYRRAAAKIMNSTTDIITKKHPLRQSVGKVSELSLQFQGGVSAFHSMSLGYNVDLRTIAGPVWDAADDAARNKASKRYERCLVAKDKQKANILPREVWIACDIVKAVWRRDNSRIEAAWGILEDAARDAVRNPGAKFQALGKVSYLFAQGFLWCRLPSGRCIAYASPRLKDQVWARERLADGSWAEQAETMDREEAEKLAIVGKVKIDGPTKPKITALGVDSTTQKLVRYPLYGGLMMENLCLGLERDVLVHGMRGVERAGYPVVLHVYDELTAEVPRGFGSLAEVVEIMCQLPAWAEGLPIAAEGWRGKRFRK